jgi:hypothetical protein
VHVVGAFIESLTWQPRTCITKPCRT